MRWERGTGSGTLPGNDQRPSGGNASAAAGVSGALSTMKKWGANRVKLRNRRVAVGAETAPSWAAVRAASASLGGAAGPVPPLHAAASTRETGTARHASLSQLGSRRMGCLRRCGGEAARLRPLEERAALADYCGGGATGDPALLPEEQPSQRHAGRRPEEEHPLEQLALELGELRVEPRSVELVQLPKIGPIGGV